MPPRKFPRFCDPEEFVQDHDKQNHGDTIYIRCPVCDGPAFFELAKRYGQCYTCNEVLKLHKHYKAWSNEAILARCDFDLPLYHRQMSR